MTNPTETTIPATEVERFSAAYDHPLAARMERNAKGGYVRFSDYTTARANAIDEAIERIKAERLHDNLDNESDRGYQNAIEHMVAALEALKQP